MRKGVRDLTEIAKPEYKGKYLLLKDREGKVEILYLDTSIKKVYEKAKELGIKKIYIKKGGIKDNPYIFY